MDMLLSLWLPIILSAVLCWIASAIIWTAMPHHKNDYQSLPDEAGFIAYLRSIGLKAGNYAIPNCSDHSRMKDPEMQRCMKEGPCGFLTLLRTPCNMGKNMVLTFLVFLVVSVLIAYVGSITVLKGTSFMGVFRVLGTVGVIAYGFSHIPQGVWFGAKRSAIINNILDGVTYGLITGVVFAMLWPK